MTQTIYHEAWNDTVRHAKRDDHAGVALMLCIIIPSLIAPTPLYIPAVIIGKLLCRLVLWIDS